MSIEAPQDITGLLRAVTEGDDDAKETLLPLVYADLKRRAGALMRSERAGHTLQSTQLVHDAFLTLVEQKRVTWNDRAHFFAMASKQMRRILVDHARARHRQKRGGTAVRVSLDDNLPLSAERDTDVLALEDALHRLEEVDEKQATIVTLRFFSGLTVDEVAAVMGSSKRSVEAEWTMIKAWIRRELTT
ncbi:MAG: sigma-70 family RNA polymerase sigma factor [Deltaproteobacteria bacterium]|nr:sigma-70 family RNA polymerase sigma factor [Deltaproteobacteria bacterium]